MAMIAAPGSGQGKTLYTAALARLLVNEGKRVKVIKLGPDYLDPMILEAASRQVVINLDHWMMGKSHCHQLIRTAARENDVVLVESVMGIHDNAPSNADLAALFGIPVILIINMAKFAKTAVAVAKGMVEYGPNFQLHGVVGNCLGSQHHHTLVSEAMGADANSDLHYLGSIRRDASMEIPERHLGLVQGDEIEDLDQRLDQAAAHLAQSEIDLSLPEVTLDIPQDEEAVKTASILAGKRIGIAKDLAFSFIYPENLNTLTALGAEYCFFSPLKDSTLPQCDILWLPGGYPELFLDVLGCNHRMLKAISLHAGQQKPIYAECGGMMYLGREIKDAGGRGVGMCNVIDASFTMRSRFQSIGHQQLKMGDRRIRGHTFHHSTIETRMTPSYCCDRQNGKEGEGLYHDGHLKLGYMHFYFPSGPELTAWLLTGSSVEA